MAATVSAPSRGAMSVSGRVTLTLGAVAVAVIAMSGVGTRAQTTPYRLDPNWPQPLPAGMKMGSGPAGAADAHGNIWVFNRSIDTPILQFDRSGKLLKSFGKAMFAFPHTLRVDGEGNIWVVDGCGARGNATLVPGGGCPPEQKKGQQVVKFSQEGKVLMVLGTPGRTGSGADTFGNPTGVAVVPSGEIFVTDGHTPCETTPGCIPRVVKFSKDGKFIKSWGKMGAAPGDFYDPHAIDYDSTGRLFVADRRNNRVQIFDQDGKFIAQWEQFGRPDDIVIDRRSDTLYVMASGRDDPPRPNPMPGGVRIGSAKTGTVDTFIPLDGVELIAVDLEGNVYPLSHGGKFVKR